MRARGKVCLYFITGIKETQNGTRAARTRARISPQHSHSKSKMRPAALRSGFFDQKRDVSESVHGSLFSVCSSLRTYP